MADRERGLSRSAIEGRGSLTVWFDPGFAQDVLSNLLADREQRRRACIPWSRCVLRREPRAV